MTAALRTILIVDDSPEDRLIYRRYLTQDPEHPSIVFEAGSGTVALTICGETRPDCILLDYNLPDTDGLRLLQALMKAAHPHVYPVVMLTGAGNAAVAVQALKNGAHDYLSKDHVTADQLRRAVENAIEKVELQQALAQQREWFRVALTSIGDAVIATDVAGYVTFLNPVAEALTGWTLATAQGQPLEQVFRMIHEETRQTVTNSAAQVLLTGATINLANPTLLLAKDGREIPIDDNAAPIRDAQGKLLGVVLVFRDITARRQAEAEIVALNRQLNQRVQELQTLLEVSPVGIALADDPECRHIWTNPVLSTLLRLPANANASMTPTPEVAAPSYRICRNGQDLPPHELPMQYAANHGVTVRDVELEVIHPDGAQYTLLTSAVPLFNEAGQVRGCIAFNVDITARKRAEEALHVAQNLIRQITDVMPDALYVYDIAQQRPIYVNQKGATLTGQTPAEMQSLAATEFVQQTMHPEDELRFRQHSQGLRTLPDNEIAEFEYRMHTADANWRWFRSRDKVFRRGTDEQVQEIIGVASDITTHKAGEQALQELNTTLATHVAERTAELEESKRDLEYFISIATHDLRDTLRGIGHLATWISEDANHLLPTTGQTHLLRLHKRIQRLGNQLDDVIAYARAGRQEDVVRAVNIQEMIAEITRTLVIPAGFTITVSKQMPTLVTQRPALETVLRHLIENAIKHHHDPSNGHIHIRTQFHDQWIEFTIQDDGPGIEPHHHDLIFRMFHTLKPRDQAEGTGVGLAIAKKVVETWGGRITVESAAGQGATFRFTWPR